jgi:AcrR family transcriptional regulator
LTDYRSIDNLAVIVASSLVVIDWTDNSSEARVMAAALQLFSSRGFQAVGIRDIAQEAGLSTAALYHYMTSKEDLLLALMSDRLLRVTRAAETALGELDAPEEQLVGLVRVHVIAHAQFPSVVVDDELRSLSAGARRAVVRLRDRYEQVWDRILERGSGRPPVFTIADLRFARLALIGMCSGVNRWFSPRGALSAESVAEHFADLALALVRAKREGRPVRLADLGLPPVEHYSSIVATAHEGVRG